MIETSEEGANEFGEEMKGTWENFDSKIPGGG